MIHTQPFASNLHIHAFPPPASSVTRASLDNYPVAGCGEALQ